MAVTLMLDVTVSYISCTRLMRPITHVAPGWGSVVTSAPQALVLAADGLGAAKSHVAAGQV